MAAISYFFKFHAFSASVHASMLYAREFGISGEFLAYTLATVFMDGFIAIGGVGAISIYLFISL